MATKDHSETEKSNVIELTKKEKGKLGAPDMITSLISAMDLDAISEITLKQSFPHRFEVIPEPSGTGVQAILVSKEGECSLLTTEHATQLLLDFVRTKIKKGWPITSRICSEAFAQWVACRRSKAIKTPIKQVAFHSQESLCWKKLKFDPIESPTPYFDEILSRVSSPDEFKAFIGSIFVEESDRSQFIWIHGNGANGKSRIIAFLQNILGDGCTPQVAPTQATERWFKSGLSGKRLAVFGDCSNTKFTSSDLFKSLTGDDVHSVERKGEPHRNETLRPKFMFMSNDRPKIVGDTAGRRRAMVVEIGAVVGDRCPARVYDQKLGEEAQGVIWACLEAYGRLTRFDSEIELGEEMTSSVQEAVEEYDEDYEIIVSKYFIIDENSKQNDWVRAHFMMDTLEEHGLNKNERSKVKKFLSTRNVVRKGFKENGQNVPRYRYLVDSKRKIEGAEVAKDRGGAGVSLDF